MALENFTLGLPKEHHWPQGAYGNSVESWMGILDNEWMVTVFYGEYDSPPTRNAKYYVTIRSVPVDPQSMLHKQWFAGSARQIAYRGYFNEIDPLMLKCICLTFTPDKE